MKNLVFQLKYLVFQSKTLGFHRKLVFRSKTFQILGFWQLEFEILGIST